MSDSAENRTGARSATAASFDERSIGQIISDITADFRQLLRDELALAKTEFNEALKKIIAGAVLLVIGSVLATTGMTALVAAAILGLATVWEAWLAALAVGLTIIVVGGILAYAGVRAFSAAQLMPDRTARTLQEDVRTVKEATQ